MTLKQNRYKLGAAVEYNSRGRHALSMTLSSHIRQMPDRTGYRWNWDERAESGTVIGRAFIDINMNGVWDAKDEILPDARLTSRFTSNYEGRTKDGAPVLGGMPIRRLITVNVDPHQNNHVLLTGLYEKKSIVLREGAIKKVTFALQPAGEIEGIVYRLDVDSDGTETMTPQSAVPLNVIRDDGTVVKRFHTHYDGHFILSGIAFGNYRISPAKEWTQQRNLTLDNKTTVMKASL